jgi:hypothetical protein
MGERGTDRGNVGEILDGEHSMRVVIGRDGKSREGMDYNWSGLSGDEGNRSPKMRDRQDIKGVVYLALNIEL